MESVENQRTGFPLFPPPLEIRNSSGFPHFTQLRRRGQSKKPRRTYNVPRWAKLNRRSGPKEVAKRNQKSLAFLRHHTAFLKSRSRRPLPRLRSVSHKFVRGSVIVAGNVCNQVFMNRSQPRASKKSDREVPNIVSVRGAQRRIREVVSG